MRHYDPQEWLLYVQGELPADLQAEMEGHLYSCDLCLDHFTASMELHTAPMPTPPVDLLERTLYAHSLENPVIYAPQQKIATAVPARRKRTSTERSRTLRNYFIAVTATVVLMVTGAFQSLFEQIGQLQHHTVSRETSVSEKLVQQTVTFFDDIQPKKK